MRYTVALLMMLLALPTFSCKRAPATSEAKKNYYADFYVRYLEAEKELKATASFFVGDKPENAKPWRAESGIQFNGSSMQEKKIQEGAYRYIAEIKNSEYRNNHEFVFEEEAGSNKKISPKMEALGSFSIEEASKESGISFNVEGGVLSKTQSLVFLFSDVNNKAYSTTINGPSTGNTFRLSPESIQQWPIGKGQIYLVKKQIDISNSGPWHVQIQQEFYSQTLDIEILE